MQKFILITIFIFSVLPVFTQVETGNMHWVRINPEHIRQYKEDPDFNYVEVKQEDSFLIKFYKKIIHYLYKFFYEIIKFIFGSKAAGEIMTGFIKATPYILLLILIYLVFRYFLGIDLIRLRKRKNVLMPKVDLSEDERIIQEENLDELITQALKNRDYRLAVRYNYLKVLKKLMEDDLIKWRADKTNRDYLKELKNSPLADAFKHLTFLYDYIWYGKFPANEEELNQTRNLVENFFSKN